MPGPAPSCRSPASGSNRASQPSIADTPAEPPVTSVPPSAAAAAPPSKGQAGQVGLSTALVRSALLKPLYLWYRTPLKLFRPLRVDYLAIARSLTTPLAGTLASLPASAGPESRHHTLARRFRVGLQGTSLGLISHAVRQRGFDFLPRYVIPPLLANSAVGTVLFATYAYSLPRLTIRLAGAADPATAPGLTTTPRLPYHITLSAGALAGGLAGFAQTLVAVPIDNLKARFQMADLISGKYPSVMTFVRATVRLTGLPALWKGSGLTVLKDTLGFALFFGTFEATKRLLLDQIAAPTLPLTMSREFGPAGGIHSSSRPAASESNFTTYAARPACVLFAGALAAFVYQIVEYPLERFHHVLRSDLAHLELRGHRTADVYRLAWRHCQLTRVNSEVFRGSYLRLFYAGFAANVVKVLPATSLGFLCFEMVRNLLEDDSEPDWGQHW
ncbi:hypothetical protein IWQ60_008130 [Tieghemiomyces parasiticus]|uniref:Mitochondrial carrier n=1 Tax=Tieghemiomyces parasiticus TaxID=78921 RepID=A0A9W8DST6_9FUNG|nr:hypothetical protein IWQ60_008130 [Tieghemiomyces parasiticus]